jgi:hypothetical protein
MPSGEDKVRTKYYPAGYTHPNRGKKKKSGFEGNNWPSTRTFYSEVSVEVIMIAKKFDFYATLAGIPPTSGKYYLEQISKEIGYPVSNYTIDGLTNRLWGPRHNPKPKTTEAILHLTEWLQRQCKKLGIWKPFVFSPHPEDQQKKQTYEHENKESRKEGRRKEKPNGFELGYVTVYQQCKKGRSRQAL